MLKNIFILSALITLVACSAKVTSEEAPPPQEKSSAGPYTVDFNNSSMTYQHSFSLPIDQSAGKVEYYVTTPNIADIEVVHTSLKVTGCSASQVIHQLLWLPDSQKTEGIYLSIGQSFKTRANVQGTFLHSLRGLDGCTQVELSTTLRQKPKASLPPRTCKESNDTTCKVEVYCAEDYPGKKYMEVEVWKESWGTTLRKYSLNDNGSRTLSSMNTVTSSNTGSMWIYSDARGSSTLRFDTSNGKGVFTLQVGGSNFPTDVTCQSYL